MPGCLQIQILFCECICEQTEQANEARFVGDGRSVEFKETKVVDGSLKAVLEQRTEFEAKVLPATAKHTMKLDLTRPDKTFNEG